MFPEGSKKQKVRLEEGSSVSHGLRGTKKEVWGEKRMRQEEEESAGGEALMVLLPCSLYSGVKSARKVTLSGKQRC